MTLTDKSGSRDIAAHTYGMGEAPRTVPLDPWAHLYLTGDKKPQRRRWWRRVLRMWRGM